MEIPIWVNTHGRGISHGNASNKCRQKSSAGVSWRIRPSRRKECPAGTGDAALPKVLVLDMSGITFMDSSGIALILRAQQRMQLLDGSILVCNVPAQARRVLDAAGIGRLVTIK